MEGLQGDTFAKRYSKTENHHTFQDMNSIKLGAVGDSDVGKTLILVSYTTGKFPEYRPAFSTLPRYVAWSRQEDKPIPVVSYQEMSIHPTSTPNEQQRREFERGRHSTGSDVVRRAHGNPSTRIPVRGCIRISTCVTPPVRGRPRRRAASPSSTSTPATTHGGDELKARPVGAWLVVVVLWKPKGSGERTRPRSIESKMRAKRSGEEE
ncbi:hypothetical protein GGX14DRAFT_585422 [Mycena pura]|uniref:Uncharacterized protein n=1 Tax=Mycena pura TaxID=153505 RepID=A0AAD6YGA5_9AGAR|nr:hypothetical protein GGX14DRAFT_585422 [Mycena pura]